MKAREDLSGKQFHWLTVTGLGDKRGKARGWVCRCVCGKDTYAYGADLRAGKMKSCGCWNKSAEKNTAHGYGRTGKNRSKVYCVWAAMLQRCSNPRDKSWKNYGGRGIRVHPAWRRFEAFLADVGEPKAGETLERIDNNAGYEPGNVKWASRREQCRNTRSNVWVEVEGVRKTIGDWAAHIGVSRQAFYYWTKKGKTHEEAIQRVRRKTNSP